MEFKIDKNRKVPAVAVNNRKYPFPDLKIGESFHIKDKGTEQVGALLAYWSKKLKAKFTSRAEDGGVRIWRTA